MPLSELLVTLAIWIGAATGQAPIDVPPVQMVPAALLHYRYCETTTSPDWVDDCLSERFTTAAFLDSSSGIIYLSQRFRPTSERDRANLVVELARFAGEQALRRTGRAAKYEGHEDVIDCGIRFERAARELGRAFLRANGLQEAELPYFEIEDGMKPWSCDPGAVQTVRNAADPGS